MARRFTTKHNPPMAQTEQDLAGRLAQGCIALRLDVSPVAQASLLRYLEELARWNRAYSLTAIRDPAEMVTRHLLDSLAILPLLHGRVLDAGSGAGLPAVPAALAAPGLRITALDSNGKKARFLRHVQRELAIANLEIVEDRVERFRPPEGYDFVVSRAFASLAEFFGVSRHLLAGSGQWVAMKGKLAREELEAVPAGIEIREMRRLQVPGLNEERHAVVAVPKRSAR